MRQVLQNYRTGEIKVDEVPAPALRGGAVLVANHFSLMSMGIERTKVETSRVSLPGKVGACYGSGCDGNAHPDSVGDGKHPNHSGGSQER